MARNVKFVPTASASNTTAVLTLEDIPQDVRDEVEEIYNALKTNPNGRMRAEFDTKEELAAYTTQVTSYCQVRPGGVIRFRKSPTKGLPETAMDFRITDVTEKPETPAETAETPAEKPATPAKKNASKAAK